MSNQNLYNKQSGQLDQNNNMLIWVVLAVVVGTIFLFAIFGSNRNESSNTPTPIPQSTQIQQDPQNTQIPQNPQETQIPQEPQSTQVPQQTTSPVPTVQL